MEPVDLFYSYAHEDGSLRDELAGHLKIMEWRKVIRSWHDRRIVPVQRWDLEIERQLENADLVLLLISSDFIHSDFIWGYELETAFIAKGIRRTVKQIKMKRTTRRRYHHRRSRHR